MSYATCADCGRPYFKERSERPLCARCEAADDEFRERMAELVRAEQASGRSWDDVDELEAERDRLRPLPLPEATDPIALVPRTVNRWVRVGRHFALRSFPVAQPVRHDAWWRPIK